jgi:macrolide transport system ATP-binding/permease protein
MVNVIRQIDPGLIADGQDTMTNRISTSQSAYLHRSAAWVVAGFALMALLLGTVGLYGVVSYSVGRSRRWRRSPRGGMD